MRVNLLGGVAHWSKLPGTLRCAEQLRGWDPGKGLSQKSGRLRNSKLESRAEAEARQDVLKYISRDARQADGTSAIGQGDCEIGHFLRVKKGSGGCLVGPPLPRSVLLTAR